MMDADLPAASPSPLRNRSLEEYRAQCQCLLVSIRHAERLDMRFENWLDRVRANDTAFIKAHLSIDPARLAMHQKNTPLTRAGVRQARHTAEELFATLGMSPKTDVVLLLSSPYLRCVQTANELASVFGVPIGIEYGLKELHDPIWYPIVPVLHSASELTSVGLQVDTTYQSFMSLDEIDKPEFFSSFMARSLKVKRHVDSYLRSKLQPGQRGLALLVSHGITVPMLSWDEHFMGSQHHGYCSINVMPLHDRDNLYAPPMSVAPMACSSNHLQPLSMPPSPALLLVWLQSGVGVKYEGGASRRSHKRVVRWLDQSGNANDAVQLEAAKQPWLHSSRSLHRQWVLRFPSRAERLDDSDAELAGTTATARPCAIRLPLVCSGVLQHATHGITLAFLLKPFELLRGSQSVRALDASGTVLFHLAATETGAVQLGLGEQHLATDAPAADLPPSIGAAQGLGDGTLHLNEWAAIAVTIEATGNTTVIVSKPGCERLLASAELRVATAASSPTSWAELVFGDEEHLSCSVIGQLAEVLVYRQSLALSSLEQLIGSLEYRIGF